MMMILKVSYHGGGVMYGGFLLSLLAITCAAPAAPSVSTVSVDSPGSMDSRAIMALRQIPSANSELSLSSDLLQEVLSGIFPNLHMQGDVQGLLTTGGNQQPLQGLDEVSVSSLTDINGTLALAERNNLPVLVVYTREELQAAQRGRSLTADAALQRLGSQSQQSSSKDEDDSDEKSEGGSFEPLEVGYLNQKRGSQQASDPTNSDTGGRGRPSPTYSGTCIRCGGPAF